MRAASGIPTQVTRQVSNLAPRSAQLDGRKRASLSASLMSAAKNPAEGKQPTLRLVVAFLFVSMGLTLAWTICACLNLAFVEAISLGLSWRLMLQAVLSAMAVTFSVYTGFHAVESGRLYMRSNEDWIADEYLLQDYEEEEEERYRNARSADLPQQQIDLESLLDSDDAVVTRNESAPLPPKSYRPSRRIKPSLFLNEATFARRLYSDKARLCGCLIVIGAIAWLNGRSITATIMNYRTARYLELHKPALLHPADHRVTFADIIHWFFHLFRHTHDLPPPPQLETTPLMYFHNLLPIVIFLYHLLGYAFFAVQAFQHGDRGWQCSWLLQLPALLELLLIPHPTFAASATVESPYLQDPVMKAATGGWLAEPNATPPLALEQRAASLDPHAYQVVDATPRWTAETAVEVKPGSPPRMISPEPVDTIRMTSHKPPPRGDEKRPLNPAGSVIEQTEIEILSPSRRHTIPLTPTKLRGGLSSEEEQSYNSVDLGTHIPL